MKKIILASLLLVIFSNIIKSQNKDSSNQKLKTLDVKSTVQENDYCNCDTHISIVIDSFKVIYQKSFSYSKLANTHINRPHLKSEILTNDSLIISYIVPGFHISLKPDYEIAPDENYINFNYLNESKVDSLGEAFEIKYIFSWPIKHYKFPIIKYQNKIIDKLKQKPYDKLRIASHEPCYALSLLLS